MRRTHRYVHEQLYDEQTEGQEREGRQGDLEEVLYREVVTLALAVVDVVVVLFVVFVVTRQVDVLLVHLGREVVVRRGRTETLVAVVHRRRNHVIA